MIRDWNQGIQDFYIELEGNSEKTKKLRQEVIGGNLRYAGFMKRQREGASLISSKTIFADIPQSIQIKLKEIQNNLKVMGFEDKNDHFYHLDSGIIFNIVYDDTHKEIVLCFTGLKKEGVVDVDNIPGRNKDKLFVRRIISIATEHLGGIPLAATQAIEIGKMLKNVTENTGISPVIIGHSHGGSIAQCAAVANGLKGVVFNSRPMGAGTRRYIGQSTIAKNASKITAFSGKDDWLSGIKALNALAVIFERVTGIPVPRTVGIGYHLPESTNGKGHSNYYNVMKKMDEMDNPLK